MYGVYRGDDGQPFVLPSVKEVYKLIYFTSVNFPGPWILETGCLNDMRPIECFRREKGSLKIRLGTMNTPLHIWGHEDFGTRA